MAKRRGKAKARRRTNKSINLLGVAESVMLANVMTTGLFNTNIQQFITGNTGSAAFGFDGSETMSLPEILGVGSKVAFGGNYGSGKSFMGEVKKNLEANWMTMAVGLVAIPIGFKVVSKVTSRPRAQANRLLRNVGIKEVKV